MGSEPLQTFCQRFYKQFEGSVYRISHLRSKFKVILNRLNDDAMVKL